MPAGQLRERVRFERRGTSADDGYGNEIAAWATLDTVAAQIRPMGGSESVISAKLEGRSPVEIVVRWSAALGSGADKLTTDDRVVDARAGTVFNIRAIENRDQRRKYLTITCDAGVAS